MRSITRMFLLFFCLILMAGVGHENLVQSSAEGQSQSETFRPIPADRIIALQGGGFFPVLVRLNPDRLAAVVRGGDAHLGIKGRLDWIESGDGGRTWTAPKVLVDSQYDDRNPALGRMPNGTIVVAYAECYGYNEQGQWDPALERFSLFYILSKDEGKTWSQKRELFTGPIAAQGNSSVFGRIIVLKDGTALLTVYGQRDPGYSGPVSIPQDAGSIINGVIRSHDNGESWGDFSLISARGHSETGLLELEDGSLIAVMRNELAGHSMDLAMSSDHGHSWTQAIPLTKPMQHPADLLSLPSGSLLLVYGNRMKPFGVQGILSHDGGKTWDSDHPVSLGWNSLNTDCGYPSLALLEDGTIVCMYYSVGTEELPSEQAIVVRFKEQDLLTAQKGSNSGSPLPDPSGNGK